MQKLIYVSDQDENYGLERINEYLQDGWRVVMISPMSGAGDTFVSCALVVIESTN